MKKDENYYLNILKESGAILSGHFLLTSGLHSATYVEKFKILQYPLLCDKLCRGIAKNFENLSPNVVLGAATGGIIISHSVGRALSTRSIFAERENNELVLRRGFNIANGERVVIVDDVVTTGGSLLELIDLATKYGGYILGIGVLIDRSGGKNNFGFPFHSLITLDIPAYKPDKCPQCLANIPLTTRGRTGKL
ncbi:MAG TPA: orotate phosphoribosyltransferase [Candidatus Marinimicrobia bacterium]|nr:orotate phosphoribosyltransferase [Candidatus Neomarinimicrobiota bacterium]HQM36738.1 orotate phosphoribosyltransferase [Candidatus Neomarinimicrobiota bacterium]